MTLVVGDYHHKKLELVGNTIDYYRVCEESVVNIKNLKLLESYSGPTSFDHTIIDFRGFFSTYISASITENELSTFVENNPWLHQIGSRTKVESVMDVISSIANTQITEIRDRSLDVVYREQLAYMCSDLGEYVDRVSDKDDMIIVPLRGGLLVASLLPNFDLRQVIPIDCKRLPIKDFRGHFAFGMSFRYFSDSTKRMMFDKYSTVRHGSVKILEVAVGSGITTIGMMLDMYIRGFLPKIVRVISPVVTAPGIALVKKVADSLGVELEVYTSKCYPRLGDFYNDRNDSVVDSTGQYVIGNASKILEPFLHLSDLEGLFAV